jgi:leucyl aminopeptidase (aminopeptidase T)
MSSSPTSADADRLGRSVLRHTLHVRPKERVTIETYPGSLPWAAGFVREARRAGAYPLIHYEDEAAYWAAAEHGQAKLVGTLADHERAALESTDVYVYFWGPEDIARRNRLAESGQEQIFAFNAQWYKVAAKAGLRGARMAIARATEGNAREFGVTLAQWRSQLFDASVADPAKFAPTVRKLTKHLGRRGEVRLTHPNGTDLTLALAGRKAVEDSGILPPRGEWGGFRMMVNVPGGSSYVAVDERTAEGTLVANRTSSASGPVLEGGRWTFEGGRLTSHRYRVGDATFNSLYRNATGAKDRPGFLEVGINPSIRNAPLLEENELGAVTVGIGNNSGFGGKNKSSMFQFLTLGGANLSIDGIPAVRRGRVV